MTQRESAIRAAIEKLDMTQEAKDTLLDVWREVDGAYAEQVQRLREALKRVMTRHACSMCFNDKSGAECPCGFAGVRAALAATRGGE